MDAEMIVRMLNCIMQPKVWNITSKITNFVNYSEKTYKILTLKFPKSFKIKTEQNNKIQ